MEVINYPFLGLTELLVLILLMPKEGWVQQTKRPVQNLQWLEREGDLVLNDRNKIQEVIFTQKLESWFANHSYFDRSDSVVMMVVFVVLRRNYDCCLGFFQFFVKTGCHAGRGSGRWQKWRWWEHYETKIIVLLCFLSTWFILTEKWLWCKHQFVIIVISKYT